MAMIDLALAVVAQGFPVFPCAHTKQPAISREDGGRGFQDATTDPDTIRRLFSHRGATLVGVPTGEESGFDVLDLDYRHGAQEWETANAHRLPETRVHRTQSGGRHYLFRHAAGVRNSAGRVGAGVDVRGEGGYVVVPPSPGYSVISDADIAEWPDWLLEAVLPPPEPPRLNGQRPRVDIESKRYAGFVRSVLDRVGHAGDGQKHFALRNAALSLGGIQDAAGLSDDEATKLLLDALPSGVKDWKTAAKTAQWGLERGRAKPIELEERRSPAPEAVAPPIVDDPGYWQSVEIDAELPAAAPEPEPEEAPAIPRIFDPWNTLRPVVFPIEAMPPAVRRFVENRARIIGADACAIAWSCLSACSAAIDGRIRLRMKRHDNWTVPAALWVALIGTPSTKKTPIMDTAWAPLHRVQARDLYNHQVAVAEWKSLPKDERARLPEPQSPRRLISHDATMESLQDILSKQHRGIGLLRDELAGWIGSMEKYAPGKGGAADRAFALQSYNGGAHVVDRVGRGTLPITNLLTVMCGGIQPDRLRQFGDLTDDGLWQRFIPVIVAPAGMGVDEPAADESQAYADLADELLRAPSSLVLHLSEEAHAIREDVQRRIYHLEQAEVLGTRFVGFCGKLVGLWGRLCLVLHLMVNRDSTIVSETTAAAARTLIFRSVLPNAARVYTAMGGAGGDIEATQSIAGYILTKRLARIVVSDLTSNVRVCRHRSVEDVRKLMSPLEAGGWIKPEKEYNATSWLISEFVHVQFADRAAREATRRTAVRALITASMEDGEDA